MEKKDWHIIPECYIDTNLTEYLLHSHGVNHQTGCNAVAKKMMESKLKDQFAIGIIDNDKRQHSYVKDFFEIAHSVHISLLKHHYRPHYLVRINPAMDQLILDCAAELNVNIQEYGLPSTLDKFIKETKDVNAKNDYRFKRLFKNIDNASEMIILRSVLNYLNLNQYKSEDEELRSFFDNRIYEAL